VTQIERDLLEELNAAGYSVERIHSIAVLPDGSEVRGVVRELAEFVKDMLVFSANELDEDTAKALARVVFAFLHARRRAGELDNIAFVSVYGPDGRSVLSRVAVVTSSSGVRRRRGRRRSSSR